MAFLSHRSSANPFLKVAALSATLLALAVAGLFFVQFQGFAARQRQLYRTYVVVNRWRPAAKREYESLCPLLDLVERIDPRRPDMPTVDRLFTQLSERETSVLQLSGANYFPTSGRPRNFSKELAGLVKGYSDYLRQLQSYRLPLNGTSRRSLAQMAASHELEQVVGPTRRNAYQTLTQRDMSLDDATLEAEALFTTKSFLDSWKKARQDMASIILGPPEVPSGLDLSFALKQSYAREP